MLFFVSSHLTHGIAVQRIWTILHLSCPTPQQEDCLKVVQDHTSEKKAQGNHNVKQNKQWP